MEFNIPVSNATRLGSGSRSSFRSLFLAALARFSALLADPSDQPTFGGRNTRDIERRLLPKSAADGKPLLQNLDTLTEMFYRYIRVMRPADTDAINLALVALRNHIDKIEYPVQKDIQAVSGICPKCGAATMKRFNHATGLPFTGCSSYPNCKWGQSIPVWC